MKKIKSSFIGKAFFSLILLYLVVFLFLFVFQGIVFRTYYTREKIKDIKTEVSTFVQKESYDSLKIEELSFSRNTNTITSIISLQNLSDNFENLDLTVIQLSTVDGIQHIFAPTSVGVNYTTGQSVSFTSSVSINDIHVPSYLAIDNTTLLRRNSTGYHKSDFIETLNFQSEEYIQQEGTILKVTFSDAPIVDSLISNEILNISSENYISIVSYDEGSYYYSNQSGTNKTSLVFYSYVIINNEPHLLISVFPMDYIDEIVYAAGRANVYMFIVVLLILILSSFVYSREFSRPLLFINNKTKELSMLDFTSPIINIDSTDEFSELANNINTLSANLQATLYQLNEQNKQLSETIAKENIIESNRRDFIQGMSHELKTPLAVIQASAEAIQNDIYETGEEKAGALELIQEEIRKTKAMLNSMISVYKLDSPDYKKQWNKVNVATLIREIDLSLSPLYKNSKIDVKLDLQEAVLNCDKDKIEMVITNLFTNAIKYTPDGEKIIITLHDSLNQITFKIVNFGVTINQENQDKIFDAFYRVDKARGRKDGSTGLGLYIVSQTLQQYDSECIVKSDNNYVEFSFTIKKEVSSPFQD